MPGLRNFPDGQEEKTRGWQRFWALGAAAILFEANGAVVSIELLRATLRSWSDRRQTVQSAAGLWACRSSIQASPRAGAGFAKTYVTSSAAVKPLSLGSKPYSFFSRLLSGA